MATDLASATEEVQKIDTGTAVSPTEEGAKQSSAPIRHLAKGLEAVQSVLRRLVKRLLL